MNGKVSHPVPISAFKEACTSFVWNIAEKLLMIYSFHSTTIAIYLGTHPRAKPYQPSLTTQDHSQGTICRKPRISYLPLVLRTLVGLNLWTGRMWPWDAPKVRLHWAVDGCDGQGVLSRTHQQQLIAALRGGDADKARAIMFDHMQTAWKLMGQQEVEMESLSPRSTKKY